jgi:hypothetical protein
MPRKKQLIDPAHLQELRQFIYQTFGKPMTHSAECEQLSKEIKRVTGHAISSNTLRRFLGFLDTAFSPSFTTLNVLSIYAGFTNWPAFIQQQLQGRYQPMSLNQEADLYLGFYQIDMKKEADMNYHNACKNIALRILSNPALLSHLSSSLAQNPVSQVYFFERFPYVDGLCGEYKRSIQLYLQKKKTEEGQVFGNALLFLSVFLCENYNELKTYHDRIAALAVHKSMHPFIVGRHIGTRLIYAMFRKEDPTPWIHEAMQWNQHFLHKDTGSFWQYPYFQHIMAGYLNLVHLFDQAHSILRTVKYIYRGFEIEKGYPESLEIVSHIAAHKTAGVDFVKWFETTNAFNAMTPLFRKFYELQALCVYRSLLKKGKKQDEVSSRISQLVEKTGFTYFSHPVD